MKSLLGEYNYYTVFWFNLIFTQNNNKWFFKFKFETDIICFVQILCKNDDKLFEMWGKIIIIFWWLE